MDSPAILQISSFEQQARAAAGLLKSLANERRLLILCHLIVEGELSVGELADLVGLGHSALSQHLARLRQEGLVGTRKERQTVYYRVSDHRAEAVLELLHGLYCPQLRGRANANGRRSHD